MKLFKRTYHTIQILPDQWWVVERNYILGFSLNYRLHGDADEPFLYEADAQKKKRELQKNINGIHR